MNILGKPLADADVLNKEPRVLLIGMGWVGQYMNSYFTKADTVDSNGYVKQDYDHYDLAVISVPTPMDKETGRCDTSIVESVVEKYKDVVDIFLVKSTVEIGTCARLEVQYKVPVCMSPEYIGETLGHPLLEPRRDAFQIIGGNKQAREKVAEYFMTVLSANAPILLVDSFEAEIIKYMENYWIAERVRYWNNVFDVCEQFNASFQAVREGIVLDPRMSRTHSNVYRNNRGFSGKCLPKDMNALAFTMRRASKPLKDLEELLKKNANEWRKGYKNSVLLLPEKEL